MRKQLAAILVGAVVVVSTPLAAWAQQGGDLVILRNGGMVRGTVVSVDPGNEVTILVLGTNEPRTLRWPEVDQVERAPLQPSGAAPPPSEGTREVPPENAESTEPSMGAPRLHIAGNHPNITLWLVDGDAPKPICAMPCDRVIDGRLGQSFYFGGVDVPTSAVFQLANRSGTVDASVDVASSGARAGGTVMMVTGGLGLAASLGLLTAGLAMSSSQQAATNGSSTVIAAAGVSGGAGAVLLAGGIVFMVTAGKTTVDLGPSTHASTPAWKPRLTANGVEAAF